MEVISVSGTELVVRIPDDLGTLCSATSGSFRVVLLESNRDATGGSFTINNGYPGYECQVTLTVQNTGDAPLEIHEIEIYPLNGSSGEISVHDIQVLGPEETFPSPWVPGTSLYGLDPGQTLEIIFKVSVLAGAQQNHTYQISGAISARGVDEL